MIKKKIAIIGSTGSIGKTTIEIVKKDKKNFDIVLLSTNNNVKEITKQIRELKPKNLVINNRNNYIKHKWSVFRSIICKSNLIGKLILG